MITITGREKKAGGWCLQVPGKGWIDISQAEEQVLRKSLKQRKFLVPEDWIPKIGLSMREVGKRTGLKALKSFIHGTLHLRSDGNSWLVEAYARGLREIADSEHQSGIPPGLMIWLCSNRFGTGNVRKVPKDIVRMICAKVISTRGLQSFKMRKVYRYWEEIYRK